MRGGATIVGVNSEDPGPSGIVDRVYAAILVRPCCVLWRTDYCLHTASCVDSNAADRLRFARIAKRTFSQRERRGVSVARYAYRTSHRRHRTSADVAWPKCRTSIRR